MKQKLPVTLLLILFLASCNLLTPNATQPPATSVPLPSTTTPIETMVISNQTSGPTVVAGSFADFRFFATEIATALQDRKTSFFDKHVASSVWNCLGDEIQGVCKDIPADTLLEGIPVTFDWTTYKVYSIENYKEAWQALFASRSVLTLVAIANRFGDNPLMPMAGQSFFAIVSIADEGDPASIHEVRVLFFEYYENTWHLAGELVIVGQIESWLTGTCSTCYDTWEAWSK